jgi:hypothetical protein
MVDNKPNTLKMNYRPNYFELQKQPDESYISEINTCVDSSLKSTIKKFNKKGIETLDSCSGVVNDHYNTTSFRKEIPYEEFIPFTTLEPFIHTKATYHTPTYNGYKYIDEFYKINRECTRVSVLHNDKKYETRINVDYVSEKEVDESFYIFNIEHPQLMIIKNKCSNYKEYDTVITKHIIELGNIIDETTK